MGKRPSYAIDITQRHPLCESLAYDEFARLVTKIGLDDAIALGFRTRERDRMLENGKKSIPKHRNSPKGLGWP